MSSKEKAWMYVVKAVQEESASREEFYEIIENLITQETEKARAIGATYGYESGLKEAERLAKKSVGSYIKNVLLDFHKSRMEGNGYDFFFKLSTDLATLQPTNKPPIQEAIENNFQITDHIANNTKENK